MRTIRRRALVGAALAILGLAASANAQSTDRRTTLEIRAGLYVPTFKIADAVDAGVGLRCGSGVQGLGEDLDPG